MTGYHQGEDIGEPELLSHLGVSREVMDSMRRGVPKHYNKVAQRRTAETLELAARMRQIGLITAIGAGGGLRIGEVLALRPRHFFERQTFHTSSLVAMFSGIEHLEQVDYGTDQWKLFDPLHKAPWTGSVRVEEQVSPLSTGQMHISHPKNRKTRTVHLQPYLYPNRYVPDLGKFVRDQLPEQDRELPLWKTGVHHALAVWGNTGQSVIPLHYLLYLRMQEIWNAAEGDITSFENALLFPARNGHMSKKEVLYPDNWPYQKEPTFKTYQNPTNLNTRYVHRVYDFSANLLNEQAGKTGRSRQGWTHHNLRHYAISQWIAHGIPLPFVSKQAGHANEGFTLSRYASAISTGYEEAGFEG
ncbi:tyrosine-type recombinase/integrase [Gordonia sp. UBA6683]|uniref:tyrosine-type recombinase/integrase n=1 Tax=Gordonia sp. UBA6683 TaxID=1946577 RepID=UPI0025C0F0B6|nr:tyrosine-type recombinase/integrase [Gordonia sp. UBA6683]